MKPMFAIARRIINQVRMDPRTVALMFAAPLFMLTVLWLVLTSGVSRPSLAILGLSDSRSSFVEALEKEAEYTVCTSSEEANELLTKHRVDAILDLTLQPFTILVDGADPSLTALVTKAVQKASLAVLPALVGKMQPQLSLVYGSTEDTMFEFMSPVLMGFVIFFFIFILSGISFLRERLDGTLDRMLVSPLSRFQIVAGYMLGFGFFAVIQTILIQIFMIYGLGTPSRGEFIEVLLVNILLCFSGLSLGSLVSAFAANEFQVFQFIPVVIVPQILFAGIFDLREAPQWLQALSYAFPITYGGDALREIMVRGKSLADVWMDMLVMLGFILLFMVLSSRALKKHAS